MARGTGKKQDTGKTYVICAKGMFVRRMDKPTEDTIERVLEKGPKKGEIVHEYHFDYLEGELLSVKRVVHENYGTSYEFEFDVSPDLDVRQIFVLKLKHDSGYSKNILFRLPNCDLKEDLRLETYNFVPDGQTKPRMGITISQNDTKILPAYSKDNKNGMPEMKQVTLNGQKVWDSTDQMVFIEDMLDSKIRPKLKGKEEKPTVKEQSKEPVQEGEHASPEMNAFENGSEEDDLPF